MSNILTFKTSIIKEQLSNNNLTAMQQLCNSNATDKIAQQSHLSEVTNSNSTAMQQLCNNSIKEKEKENIYNTSTDSYKKQFYFLQFLEKHKFHVSKECRGRLK